MRALIDWHVMLCDFRNQHSSEHKEEEAQHHASLERPEGSPGNNIILIGRSYKHMAPAF